MGGDILIAGVLVEISNKNVDKIFDYKIPDDLISDIRVGIRVLVPFGRMKEITLKDETITCDVIVICPQEKAIYYHAPDTYTVKKVTLKGCNFDKLSKFLSSYN